MPTKNFTNVDVKGIARGDIFGYWELQAGDDANPLICPRFSDKCLQIFGTWGGATVELVGTNDPALAEANFKEVYDFEGYSISQTSDRKAWQILPNLYAIKPKITGGDGTTSLTIALVGRGGLV